MGTSITPEPVQRLGDFEIVRELGRGGMGVVYEARQISLNRKVALKVLSAGLGLSDKAIRRFRREAEAAAKLHHTNIVPIYATGATDGVHYYAMELIEGPSLDHVIRQLRNEDTPLSSTSSVAPISAESMAQNTAATLAYERTAASAPSGGSSGGSTSTASGSDHFDRIARMVAEVADGLEYAHRQGVIHRDIKPSNLLLTPQGGLCINDFGLALVLAQPGITMTGEFVGTPAYMSPEQITAGRAPLDHRTDIYSLGATLYELLTLQRPFGAERRDQIIAQIMHKEPAAPRSLNRQVPVDLETICLKAMEKDPDRRYQTAGALAEDLRRYLTRFAIQARRAGPVERLRKWVRRHPGLSAGLAGMLILALALAAFAYRAQVVERQQQERHEEELRSEKRQAAMEKAQLAAVGCQFDEAEDALRDAERLGASTGEVRMLRGWIACYSDRTVDGVQDLEQAVELLPQSVAARAMLSVAYSRMGEWGKSTQALREMNDLSPQSPQDYLFAGYAWASWDPRKGARMLDEAVQRRSSPLARVFRAEALENLATETGTVDDAENAVREAEVAKQLLPGQPAPAIVALGARILAAAACAAAGNQEKRAQLLREARGDAETLKQVQHSAGAMIYRWLFLVVPGEQDSMAGELRKAVDQIGHPRLVFHYAAYLYERGQNGDALALLQAHLSNNESQAMRPYLLAELPGGKPLAIEACNDMAKKDWYGWDWAYGQSALSLLGRSADLAAAAGDFQRGSHRFPVAERDDQLFRKLLAYWAGEASDRALLDAARGSGRNLCRAHYFIGISKLSRGERAAARQEFRASAASDIVSLWAWQMSKIMLARLNHDPNWPPWIPMKK